MLKNIENLVRENAQEAIVNNQAVPNEKNEEAIQAASGSLIDVLKEKVSSGNIGELISSFQQGNLSGTTADEVSNKFTDKLQGLGIDLGQAKNIAATIIPTILAKFTQKTSDPNDSSFDLQDILGNITGEDGKFQLSDLGNLFNKGQDQNPDAGGESPKKEDGGIMGKLNDLF